MNDLTLVNDKVPAFQKPDPAAWKQPLPVEANCQLIYNHLQKAGDEAITLADLSTSLQIGYMSVYWAARRLVLGGFAIKKSVKVPAPTKRNPEKYEWHIGLRYVEPWAKKPERAAKW